MRRAASLVLASASDPVEVVVKAVDRVAERDDRATCDYEVDLAWEQKLHTIFGAPWPCPERSAFETMWDDVQSRLAQAGVGVGRGAFGGWGDADPAFARATWCAALHGRPRQVVETGVARGVTSRFILEALARNGAGKLWSIDLPPPLDRHLHEQIGLAVPTECRARWTYVRGSSRRRLPSLVADLGRVDLFVHDSRHSTRNVCFELDCVAGVLRPGGVLLVDDIDLNSGFRIFTASHPRCRALVAESEPLEPDPERQQGVGVFGIVVAT